jgi:hypothetical protein
LPRSHLEALSGIHQKYIDGLKDLPRQFEIFHPGEDHNWLDAAVAAGIAQYHRCVRKEVHDSAERFGVSCWHRNDYESEAMWRAYPAESVAVESTISRLSSARRHEKNVTIDDVRYENFDTAPIEKGRQHYGLFLKRKSFEYEQELRATVLLGEAMDKNDKGALLSYDLDALISQVHTSPRASATFRQTVIDVTSGAVQPLNKPIIPSKLYEEPDYNIELKG